VSAKETKSRKLQPKTLHGYVRAEMVKCGKSTCRCAKGEPHGPYFYYFEWSNGKRKKRYVRPEDLRAVRSACAYHRALKNELKVARERWRELSRLLSAFEDK
jgi:hypothetical protein